MRKQRTTLHLPSARFLSVLFLSVLLLSFTFVGIRVQCVRAENATGERDYAFVYDYADVLSTAEETDLTELCKKYGKKGKADLVIVTVSDPNGKDCEIVLEDMYDEIAFGYDQPFGDTVMIIIDLYRRDVCIEGYGKAMTQVNQSRGDYIREKITPDLSQGDYYDAFADFTRLSARCMRLKAGVHPGNPLLYFPVQLILSLIVGAITVSIMAFHSKGRDTTTSETYRNHNGSRMLEQRDDFIRTDTTRVKRASSSSGGGGHRSGGGGGRSSGGHSHSTSRGKF